MSTEAQYKTGTKEPVQQQKIPGLQADMNPQPLTSQLPSDLTKTIPTLETYKAAGKLQDKIAFITGGDSGIGRAVAALYAMEGADVAINYLDSEEKDAQETKRLVEKAGRKCLLLPADLVHGEKVCKELIDKVVKQFGRVDILVNNAAQQMEIPNFLDYTEDHIEKTFKVNILSHFYLSKAAIPHMRAGSTIINTASVNHYKGHPQLIDYSTTKGAIVAFTRSLSLNVIDKGIRVNAVAPGPIWTPLIVSTMSKESIESFGGSVPMKRPGQPVECATCYVFLASNDSSYISGQTLHPNGGAVING